ncbi:hypothetical protein [Sphingomonas jaspsi]|uniref:hypothetical protein n=1 Tax=Sphingomonas jaspsi TaxID=392409 RepID=UPI0004ACE5B6|nr:hypothetical protein [Sphingomonas jaspsi]
MGEPKTFASLSSGLLARKGAARPAMRPQGFGQVGAAGLEDLGWNDMGFEAPKPALTPVRDSDHDAFGEEVQQPSRNPLSALTPASPVHSQQAEIEQRFNASDEEGEDENGEYIDETAELYEPEAEAKPTFEVRKATALPTPEPEAYDEPMELVEEATPTFVAPAAIVPVAPAPVAATPVRPRRPRAAPGSKGKAAFTLRLDSSRHLKLRLACAVTGRSAQQLVTDALDQLLDGMPELDSMAEKAPKTAKTA